jgi:hypothetical protein
MHLTCVYCVHLIGVRGVVPRPWIGVWRSPNFSIVSQCDPALPASSLSLSRYSSHQPLVPHILSCGSRGRYDKITEAFMGSKRRAMSEGVTEIPTRRRFSYILKQIDWSQWGFGDVILDTIALSHLFQYYPIICRLRTNRRCGRGWMLSVFTNNQQWLTSCPPPIALKCRSARVCSSPRKPAPWTRLYV